MTGARHALGMDFGSASCRAVVVRLDDGAEIAESTYDYPSGDGGVLTSPDSSLVARQHPRDYLLGLESVMRGALAGARDADPGFDPATVVGVGVATTGSTPMPVDAAGQPLALDPEFADDLDAMAWLWKDHTAHEEADAITRAARATRPDYVAGCGDTYSSEWFWAKAWHCARVAPRVFDAAASWVELCDFLPATLIGDTDPRRMPRSVCAAGHKAMFDQRWGGLPDADFLGELDPALAALRPRLFDAALEAGARAGGLDAAWAARTGLRAGTPVAIGAFDAHAAALGAGVREGVFVSVMGTSTCDVTIQPVERAVASLPGVCGVVPGSVVPGFVGIESGQSGVGDMFRWFVDGFVPETSGATRDARYAALSSAAAALAPGEHGLVALDWVNGNRTILVDHTLSGLIVGLNLQTEPHHVFQALIESTAFGARRIVEHHEEHGVPVRELVASGGLPGRNPGMMQTYANVLGRRIRVSASEQTSALGAATLGALAAGAAEGGFATPAEAQDAVVRYREDEYVPEEAAVEVYDRLYGIYRRMHDAFGLPGRNDGVGPVMRDLFALRTAAAPAVTS
ncbi:MAG: L-ribulokinase [Solirubrobacteraceae bacterium]|jgi:L-ribulokinase|nr:L-ribulokinase [Solirubrobacteraceae bacterium]